MLYTGFLKLIWLFLACDFILVPVPTPTGDAYAAKWVCKR